MNPSTAFADLPERLLPYIVSNALNESILVAKGPFRLVGPSDAVLDGDLRFRWLPSTAVEFDGSYAYPLRHIGSEKWLLVADSEPTFSAPALLTDLTLGPESSVVRG